jgi:hypothetical protein
MGVTDRPRRLAVLAVVLMSSLLVGTSTNAAEAEDWELLPDAALHLEGARYAPTDTEAAWASWVGAGVGVFRFRNATAYLAGDAETVFGNARRTFDADQVNYHLEGGARFRLGRWLLVPFFHHVSRRLIDRPKEPNDDWNIAGARLARTNGVGDRLALRYEVGLGRNVPEAFGRTPRVPHPRQLPP